MAAPLKNGTGSGGSFVNASDHKDAKAVLFEPKKVLYDQPGKFGKRNIAVGDMTIFRTMDELTGELPPLEVQSAKITGKIIVEEFEGNLGGAMVGKFVALPNPKGDKPMWAIRPVDQAVFERVAAFAEAREAEMKAAMETGLPDWATA